MNPLGLISPCYNVQRPSKIRIINEENLADELTFTNGQGLSSTRVLPLPVYPAQNEQGKASG